MRVLVADDHPEVRSALRLILEQQPDLTVVAEANDADALLARLKATNPDLVLLDWELVGKGAADLVTALRSIAPGLSVIVISGRPESCCAAMACGVDAFVSKGDPPERLLSALHSVESHAAGHRGC